MDIYERILSAAENQDGELDISTPERYAAKVEVHHPKDLSIYVYQGGAEIGTSALGTESEYEAFAGWAADQGGELARLAHLGHTDEYNGAEGVQRLAKQLGAAEPPFDALPIADKLAEVVRNHADAEGLVVSDEPRE